MVGLTTLFDQAGAPRCSLARHPRPAADPGVQASGCSAAGDGALAARARHAETARPRVAVRARAAAAQHLTQPMRDPAN
jgi:hypothetical protein